jgi:hypothetical protein
MKPKFSMTDYGYRKAKKWLKEHDFYRDVQDQDGYTQIYYANYKYDMMQYTKEFYDEKTS